MTKKEENGRKKKEDKGPDQQAPLDAEQSWSLTEAIPRFEHHAPELIYHNEG